MRFFNEHAKLIHLDSTIQCFNISKYTGPVQEIILLQFRLPMSRFSLNLDTHEGFHSGIVWWKKKKKPKKPKGM